jgi:hypothetical protein
MRHRDFLASRTHQKRARPLRLRRMSSANTESIGTGKSAWRFMTVYLVHCGPTKFILKGNGCGQSQSCDLQNQGLSRY